MNVHIHTGQLPQREILKPDEWPLHIRQIRKQPYSEFPGGPVVRIPGFLCCDPASVPGQGAEILQAEWCSQKKDTLKQAREAETHSPHLYHSIIHSGGNPQPQASP